MSAESITGQVDNCLFSLHKPQSIGRTSEQDLLDVRWSRMVSCHAAQLQLLCSLPLLVTPTQSRFRIDGVPIDHMQSAHDTGVLSWVTSGRCDLVADIRFPREEDVDLSTIVADIVDEIGSHLPLGPYASEAATKGARIPGRQSLSKSALEVPKGWSSEDGTWRSGSDGEEDEDDDAEEEKKVSIDLDIRFKDLKASVPVRDTCCSAADVLLICFLNAVLHFRHVLHQQRPHSPHRRLYQFQQNARAYSLSH